MNGSKFGCPKALHSRRERTVREARVLSVAFHWKRMLVYSDFGTIAELVDRKEFAPSYTARVLRPTLLALVTIEAILDGSSGET